MLLLVGSQSKDGTRSPLPLGALRPIGHDGILKFGTFKVGIFSFGSTEVGFPTVGSLEVGTSEVGLSLVGRSQADASRLA
jgi:hypothetical protein